MLNPTSPLPGFSHGSERRRLAQRVADAHRGLDDSSLLAYVSGSVVDGLADERSNVDMGIVMHELPPADTLEAACRRAGGEGWRQTGGGPAAQPMQVVFTADGIEVQVAYSSHAVLHDQIDELLLRHNPDTPLHLQAESILKAEPLFGQRPLQALQARLADFPPALALAMARHFSATPTPWPLMRQLLHRDAPLSCRALQVQACGRLLGLLAAVNQRYHGTGLNKRLHHFAAGLDLAPPGLADRIEALLSAPPRGAALALHALEGEVLSLVEGRFPGLELAAVHASRAGFASG